MRLLIFLLVFSILASCKRDGRDSFSHTAYFDQAIATAENIRSHSPQHAMQYVDSSLKAFPKATLKDRYRVYAYREEILYDNQDTSAAALADSMLWLLRKHTTDKDFAQEYANALFRKSQILMWKRDFTHAFEYDFKARESLEKVNDPCMMSQYTNTLAMVSFREEKYEEAAGFMKQAVGEMGSCKEDFRVFRATQGRLDDIGVCYFRLGMYDSALIYYSKALKYLDAHVGRFPEISTANNFIEGARGVVFGNIGDIFLAKGDTATGDKYYHQDIAINSLSFGDPGDLRCTQEKLANLYLAQGRIAEAGSLLAAVRTSLDKAPGDKEGLLKWYALELDYLNRIHATQEMYNYIAPYLKLRDSLNAMKQLPTVNLQEEYASVKTQYELITAEKENQRKDFYLIIFLSISILLVIIAFLLWYSWRRTRKLNGQVNLQNAEMEQTLKSLNESQKENAELMQVVAHDLRNPMASMISIISILQENPALGADDKELLDLMNTSSQHAMDMITDLMSSNTSFEGMKKEPVDISSLIKYCIDLLRYRAAEKGQRIIIETQPAVVALNREKIWRVVNNLVGNAVKFSESGKDITIHAYRKGDEYIIMVRDEGIGIPENLQRRVFNMFTNARRIGTSGEKSFGMGLAISQKIIEAHGGRIWFESETGKGTTFYVALPMR